MDTDLQIHFAAALLAVMNPLGNLPLFIAATSDESTPVRRWVTVFLAGFITAALLVCVWAGQAVLDFFGISLPAFRIAGGIILLLTGLGMVRGEARRRVDQLTEALAGDDAFKEAQNQIKALLIPLGIPLFVGPGSISTVILFSGRAADAVDRIGLSLVVVVMGIGVLALLLLARPIGRMLGGIGLDVAARLMGLVLAAMGIQFLLAGLAAVTDGVFILTD